MRTGGRFDIGEPKKDRPFLLSSSTLAYRPATRQRQEKRSLEPVPGASTHFRPHTQSLRTSTHHALVNLMPQYVLLGHLLCWGWVREANSACVWL